MEPDLLSKDLSACPRCGAGVRADAPWCTQCFLNLRQAPAPPPAPVVPAQTAPPVAYAPPPTGVDPLTAPLHAVVGDPVLPSVPEASEAAPVERTWPCTACGTANSFELDACAACGQGFLASLAGGGASLVLPGVGDLAAMSKGKRMALAFGSVVALMLLVLVLGLLLG